ncbi:glycan biosynthesis hexose transferase WsfD [Paenibacillus sp. MMO-58]|uniref:glycan biosynthesis hexose transferase WsfD n=1 Tax=Paenibacillus sp. MMO-58 TaxID=3081290 RepID=UPI0030161B1D
MNKLQRMKLVQTIIAWQKYISPASLAAFGVALILLIELFIPPFIGMADNGDYYRILYSNGLYFNAPDYTSQTLGYFVKNFGIFQYYNENSALLYSSQTLFVRLSLMISEWFGYNRQFDIRIQAALYGVLYVGAVYLLVKAAVWKASRRAGYGLALGAIFVFGDIGYLAYFNSFYSESVVLIMLMYLFSAGMLLYQRQYNDYFLLFLFGASAMILTTSKQQNAPIGLVVAMVAVLFVFLKRDRIFRTLAGLQAVVLLLTAVGTYVLIPEQFVNINKYHAMTRGVLMTADNPEQALDYFGIDKQFAVLTGAIYYDQFSPIPVESEEMQTQFLDKYGFPSIARYYLTHPDSAGRIFETAAHNAFSNRTKLGNYEESAGKPFGARTWAFSGYSYLKEWAAPKTSGFVVLWMIVIVGLYAASFYQAVKERALRRTLRLSLILMMMLSGLCAMAVSVIGAGDADLAKHEFLFAVAFDLVTFWVIADCVCRRLWGPNAKKNAGEEDPEPSALLQGGQQ